MRAIEACRDPFARQDEQSRNRGLVESGPAWTRRAIESLLKVSNREHKRCLVTHPRIAFDSSIFAGEVGFGDALDGAVLENQQQIKFSVAALG
jgi:hypothetical protein